MPAPQSARVGYNDPEPDITILGEGVVNLQTVIILIAGILVLGVIWRVIRGLIRFVLIIGVGLLLLYIVLNVLR